MSAGSCCGDVVLTVNGRPAPSRAIDLEFGVPYVPRIPSPFAALVCELVASHVELVGYAPDGTVNVLYVGGDRVHALAELAVSLGVVIVEA